MIILLGVFLLMLLQPSAPTKLQVIVYPGHHVTIMDTDALRQDFKTEYIILGNSNHIPNLSTTIYLETQHLRIKRQCLNQLMTNTPTNS